jgi:hypothetical protein
MAIPIRERTLIEQKLFDIKEFHGKKKSDPEGITWLKEQDESFARIKFEDLKKRQTKATKVLFGEMYTYRYRAETPNLPVWDRYPCIMSIFPRPADDGFYGLNLHYLPVPIRAQFLFNFLEFYGVDVETEGTKKLPKYSEIQAISRLRWYKYCIKHYKYSRIESAVYNIHPNDWPIVPFLPTQQFVKMSKFEVWSKVK